mgnify:CR=1 FL=1
MRQYIYKIIIAMIAIILVFEFTIGNKITQITDQISMFSSADGRKKIVNSLKKEIAKANERENYLDPEERILIKTFINKIKKELNTVD